MNYVQKVPVAICGVALGFAALGNLSVPFNLLEWKNIFKSGIFISYIQKIILKIQSVNLYYL